MCGVGLMVESLMCTTLVFLSFTCHGHFSVLISIKNIIYEE